MLFWLGLNHQETCFFLRSFNNKFGLILTIMRLNPIPCKFLRNPMIGINHKVQLLPLRQLVQCHTLLYLHTTCQCNIIFLVIDYLPQSICMPTSFASGYLQAIYLLIGHQPFWEITYGCQPFHQQHNETQKPTFFLSPTRKNNFSPSLLYSPRDKLM